jgi:hypothetical protein
MSAKLRARARELTDDASAKMEYDMQWQRDLIEAAILAGMREALREEPDVYMSEIARIVWRDEAEARARGLE